MSLTPTTAIGAPVDRIEGREKVTGAAKYAYEYRPGEAASAVVAQATIARGRVRSLDATAALALPGVLAVIWNQNAPRLHEVDDGELAVLQSPRVAYRGQVVATVVADRYETARQAERLIRVEYTIEEHDVVLRSDHPGLYKPDTVNPRYRTDTDQGDFDRAFATAETTIDCTYVTPAVHNNPMEPHAASAAWHGDHVTIYDSSQGATRVKETVAQAFGLRPEHVRVISPHVGGGFGSKGTPRPHVILAAMASRVVRRPVKLALTRQQMFAIPATGRRRSSACGWARIATGG